MTWERMSAETRIKAVHVDFMKHPEFALLSGVTMVGKVFVKDDMPTAGTNGRDVYYGREFVMGHNRKQIRYLVAHENLHKALRHCVEYKPVADKYGMIVNAAMDYVINQMIEDMDTKGDFVERPHLGKPLIDPKYKGMSFLQVLKDLLKDAQQQQSGGKGGKGGTSAGNGHQSLDEHMFDEAEEMSPAEAKKVQQQVEDAVRQGKLLAERMRGDGKGGADLSALTAHRDTNWREYLREFLSTICQGDDNSRFCPPNKRMLASGFVMPSHFSESTGEIIVACDTSGSMGGVYPVVFGEIARICEHARPESVRVLWWDTDVNSEQVFKPDQYDQIAGVLKPQGGGGTTVSVVARYIAEKQLKPKAVVYLSDGYVESDYEVPDVPCLWGIVDNDSFMPLKGKVVRIYSEGV